jgi:hypothetical protein
MTVPVLNFWMLLAYRLATTSASDKDLRALRDAAILHAPRSAIGVRVALLISKRLQDFRALSFLCREFLHVNGKTVGQLRGKAFAFLGKFNEAITEDPELKKELFEFRQNREAEQK